MTMEIDTTGAPSTSDKRLPTIPPEPASGPAGAATVDGTRSAAGLLRAVLNDQRIRYLATGGITAVVYYAIFSAGWLLLHGRIPYLAMAVIANLLTAVLTYPIYRVAVFRATGPWLAGFARFYAVFVWGLVFSLGGLPLLVEVVHMNVLIAQAIILVASPLINYQLHKLWAFRHRK
jgi:putative flippase GtrA